MAPHCGLEIICNGQAIRLLYHLEDRKDGQLWRVQPLFVDEDTPEKVMLIRSSDPCRPLHTQYA